LPPSAERRIPTCSEESEKGIALPEMVIGLQTSASFTFNFWPEGVKPRSFVFSGTKVTWNAEQYCSARYTRENSL
jgi:hypothetical protein